jgi:hypothetical protein
MHVEDGRFKDGNWFSGTAEMFTYPSKEKCASELQELKSERLVDRMKLLQSRLVNSAEWSMAFATMTSLGIILMLSKQITDLTWSEAIPTLGSLATMGIGCTYIEHVTKIKLGYVHNGLQQRLLK